MAKQKIYLVGTNLFLLIFLLANIHGLFINDFLTSFFMFFRYLLLVVIGLLLTKIVLNSKKLKKNIIMALVINLSLLVYALYFGEINSGNELNDFGSYFILVLSFFFTLSIFFSVNENDYFLINKIKNNLSLKPSIPMNYKLLGAFYIFVILLVYFGSDFSFLSSKINFNVDAQGIPQVYNQNTTNFFAFGAIFFTFIACALKNKISFFFIIIAMLYFYFSFLSGGRGGIIVGFVIINLILFKFLSVAQIILYLFSFSGLLAGILFYEIIDLSNLIALDRFKLIFNHADFGYRDVLLRQSFELLSDRLVCVLIGCGFNFFQVYYGYDAGMYPHNIFLELIITFGFLIAVPLILLTILGCVLGYLSKFGNTFMFYVMLHFLGIHLLSGNLVSIVAISIILYFSYISLKSIKANFS
jgi:hypothetical protein